MDRRIVVVSDDEQLRSLLCGLLFAHGYVAVTGSDTPSALAWPPQLEWDAAIVDTSVSHTDSLYVLERLCDACTATVVIAAKNLNTSVSGNHGSVVVIGKPFDPRELLLVIRGMLEDESDTRVSSGSRLSAGPIELLRLLNRATVAEREVSLTDVETRILSELMVNVSRAVARERLARRALLRDESPDARSLDTHINRLRRKLGHDRGGRTPIRTVRGVGYLLVEHWEPAP